MKNLEALLVDDEEIIRVTLAHKLKKNGFKVTLADNADAAVALIQERNFDLIITDLTMDIGSGLDVLKEAKKNDPSTPVIMLSGFSSSPQLEEAAECGASFIVLKPCSFGELFEKIQASIKA
ncbi:MAG: response regulator [Candidatus Nitrohelix vancouverensis]|uniref:Response regulator n=1 Tax=Candidatus Nitrohelix vancouverensis TaxID=2705534 RepID=A0A7T0G2E7_9BACT|nr:MAG: response regulator [Candidatus Nitrohelix vancouverensis]